MEAFGIVFVVILGIYFLIHLIHSIVITFSRKKAPKNRESIISVLVAARNEEDNISECLESLSRQDYPREKIEFLIGNDDSEDSTGDIIEDFAENHENFRAFHITKTVGKAKGKQNVLAQLAREANGEILLVTDADITHPPEWAASLTGEIRSHGGMSSGVTLVEGKSLFARLQRSDWLMGMCLQKSHSDLGIPITAVGNNMAVSREAYESSGGYENIEFSITEDYKLFKELCEKGPYRFTQRFDPDCLCASRAPEKLTGLLKQRKRWFKGGAEVAWYNKSFLVFNACVMPVIIAAVFLLPFELWLTGYGVKWLSDFILILAASSRLKRYDILLDFPVYELYYQLVTTTLPTYQLIPGKVEWKGRKYE